LSLVAPVVVVRLMVGAWQAWLTAGVVFGAVLVFLLFALCRFRTKIVDFLSSRLICVLCLFRYGVHACVCVCVCVIYVSVLCIYVVVCM